MSLRNPYRAGPLGPKKILGAGKRIEEFGFRPYGMGILDFRPIIMGIPFETSMPIHMGIILGAYDLRSYVYHTGISCAFVHSYHLGRHELSNSHIALYYHFVAAK